MDPTQGESPGERDPEKAMILCVVTIFGVAIYHPRLHLVSSTLFVLILVHFILFEFEVFAKLARLAEKKMTGILSMSSSDFFSKRFRF